MKRALEDAKGMYGTDASTSIYTRKNYLNNIFSSLVPAEVKDKVIGFMEKMVSKSRIITFLGGLLVGILKYKRLQDPETQNLPYTGKLHGLYNEVTVLFINN
jgi:hypothetical protein